MSVPFSAIVPPVGGNSPLMTLNSVVFPAPLGPMTRMSCAGLHRQRHIIDSLEPAEMPRDALELEGRVRVTELPGIERFTQVARRVERPELGDLRKRVDHGVLQLAVHALDAADVDVLDRIAVLVEFHRPARKPVGFTCRSASTSAWRSSTRPSMALMAAMSHLPPVYMLSE